MTSMPFYVSPEQLMKDRADYARKGIARGRSVVVLGYDKGIAFVAENPSRALHKVSEIYDRIAFAAVGKYNEFENLRVAGVRYADLRGYSYDRTDVTRARAGQRLRADPRHGLHPGVQALRGRDRRGRGRGRRRTTTRSTGSPTTARSPTSSGSSPWAGRRSRSRPSLKERWSPGLTLGDALRLAVDLLATDPAGGEPRSLGAAQLEVAVLDRERPRRTFRRIGGALLDALLSTRRPHARRPVRGRPHTGSPRHAHRRAGRGRRAGTSQRDASTNPQTQRPAGEPGAQGDAGSDG